MTDWVYQDKPFKEEQIGDAVGFVYLIKNNLNGKQYIGKKLFTFAKTQRPLKGRINRRRSRVASHWVDYFGSNKHLHEDIAKHGKKAFTRTILKLCKSKGTANYFEAKLILENDAIVRDDWYNSWLAIKINRSQIKQ